MAATRRRSRYLGKPGIGWSPGDERCDGSFALQAQPQRLPAAEKADAPLPGSPGRRRPPAIPQAGRRPVLDGESYTASPRGAIAVYANRPGFTPCAGLRGLRALLQQTSAAGEEKGRSAD